MLSEDWRRGWVLREQMQCGQGQRFGLAAHRRRVITGGCSWEKDRMVISGRQLIYC